MERQDAARFDAELQEIETEMSFIDREEFALVPQMDETRRHYLEALAKKCNDLASRRANDPALQRKKAEIQYRLGTILELLVRYAEAEERYREAIGLLSGTNPNPADYPNLDKSRHHYANLLKVLGRLEEAEPQYRSAIELVSRNDVVGDLRYEHAETLHDAAKLQVMIGRYEEGENSLRQALDLQRQLVLEQPSVAKLQLATAAIETSLANLLLDHSRLEESGTLLQSAIEGQEKLLLTAPNVPVHHLGLARTLNVRARWFDLHGQRFKKQSTDDLIRAYFIFKKLAADHPQRPDYRLELASAEHFVARAPVETKTAMNFEMSIAAMEKSYRDAVAQQDRLVTEFPAYIDHHHRLALSLNSLATWLCDKTLNDVAKAEREALFVESVALHERAEAIWVRLSKAYPKVIAYQNGLALSHQRFGIALEKLNRLDEAENRYRQAIVIQEELAAKHPTIVRHLSTASALHNNLGVIHDRRNDLAGAEREFRMALDFSYRARDKNPANITPNIGLTIGVKNMADVLLRLGRYQEAAPFAKEWGRFYTTSYWNYNEVFELFDQCIT